MQRAVKEMEKEIELDSRNKKGNTKSQQIVSPSNELRQQREKLQELI
jgi:hypothetical protein